MPHAAHFICGQDCRFHLATRIGKYLISTVGEYFPDAPTREIIAESRKIVLIGHGDERRADYMKRIGWEDIGHDRKYETMIFKAGRRKEKNSCCPWTAADWLALDFAGYKRAEDAYAGHLRMCQKWAQK